MNNGISGYIVRGSTSELSFAVPEEVENIINMWVTFSQGNEKLNLTLNDFTLEGNVFTHLLSQEETLLLDYGLCEVQIKFLTEDGHAPMSYPLIHIKVCKALKPEVIGDEES